MAETGSVPDDVETRFIAALNAGSPAAIADWAATGRPGLALLRRYLEGSWDPPTSDSVHPRDFVDNTSAAVAAIAAAHPADFLEEFDEGSQDSYVLTGLGMIDDARATARLVRAAGHADWTIRMQVAIGLGRRPSTSASDALARLAGDIDALVRHHALRSLERIGDATALSALRSLRPSNAFESDLVNQAIASIQGRGNTTGSSG